MCATALPSVTSHMCGSAVPPALAIKARVSESLAPSRSTANTFAPSSAKRTAVARPLPQPGATDPAPLTIATRS
jgi:hypothetical protein